MEFDHEVGERVARQWLDASARTATGHDLSAHMDLISREVKVFGVPGFDMLGFDDWARQCEHEFSQALLKSVSYAGLKLRAVTTAHVMFKTVETIETKDGVTNRHGIEAVIELEPDGVWRLTQQRVLEADELEHDKLDRE